MSPAEPLRAGKAPWRPGDPLTLIINVNARRGAAALGEAATLLRSKGVSVRPVATTSQAQADAAIRSALRRGDPAVIVGGGDGTLSHAAALLVGSRTALGVLPLGTGNTFARSISVPLKLWDAAGIVAEGKRAAVDVGQVAMDAAAPQVFLNSVGLGFSAEIARQLNTQVKQRLGLLAWPLVGLRVLLGHHPLDLELRLGEPGSGGPRHLHSHQLLIANGRYVAGPLKAAPDAAVNDHRLDVLTFGTTSLMSATAAALRWASGHGGQVEAARQLQIRSRSRPIWVSVDGEVSRHTELDLSIRPAALWVLVPGGFAASEV